MSTIVGTNIEVTNIKFDSDTTAMIVSSAGGGAGTVPQGLTKAWAGMASDATPEGSFNISKIFNKTILGGAFKSCRPFGWYFYNINFH